MAPTPLMAATGVVMIAIVGASAAAWLWIVQRSRQGDELLAYEPRRRMPWSGAQLLALLLAYLLLHVGFNRVALDWAHSQPNQPAAGAALPREPRTEPHDVAESPQADSGDEHAKSNRALSIPELKAVLLLNVVVNLLFALAVIAVLRCGRARAAWADLGLPLTRLFSDLRAGAIGFIAASVPVQLLNVVLNLVLSENWKGEHPIVTFLSETSELSGVLIATGAAVAVAPLVEELLFRVVLQGWLEAHEPRLVAAPASPSGRTPVAWRPIVVTSASFALLHGAQGPAPVIPLFGLALVLGYLYQRTHRIWASVTLHFLFNLTSLLALWVTLSTKASQ
ncbi:MAG TPA: CPBP family intramembrane glutamic endopeptidase [Pirellulales bacterium]